MGNDDKGLSGLFTRAKKMAGQSLEGLSDILESAKEVQSGKLSLDDVQAGSSAARNERRQADKAAVSAEIGDCLIDRLFALSRIRIYEHGFVQIGSTAPERLLAIKGEADINSKTGPGRFVGSIIAMPLLGGVPNNMLGPSVRGDLMLTIHTDVDTHTIHTRTPMPEFIKALRELDTVGNSILARLGSENTGVTSSENSVSTDVSEQLSKLADLKSQGLLDDAEFAAAKAKLLGL